jgi:hypothetical protein
MTSSTLTPQAFIDKWRPAALKERLACQEHFIAGGGSGSFPYAVFAAYSWPVDLSDDEILARWLELNLSRSSQ